MRRQADRLADIYAGIARTHDYWRTRARELGCRAVFDKRHKAHELDAVTSLQRATLLPVLRARLNGTERVVLDFGCGWGRFTVDIADTINNVRVIGIEPVESLLRLAPQDPRVLYVNADAGVIPLASHSVDVAWITLVLGCLLNDALLARTTQELRRVLRTGAVLLIAENTSEKPDLPHFRYRSADTYRRLFPEFDLQLAAGYDDIDERITVLAGRSSVVTAGAGGAGQP